MEIRIRALRKSRGLTLQELADLVGTTAQTVQRLETANMTVSTDWLERFAEVFGVHPADLMRTERQPGVALLDDLGIDGTLRRGLSGTPERFVLDVPANDPVAVRLEHAIGPDRS